MGGLLAQARPQMVVMVLVTATSCLPALLSISNQAVAGGHSFIQPAIVHAEAPPKIVLPDSGAIEAYTSMEPAGPVDCRSVSCVALTFDDGPNPITTTKVLDALDEANAPATFFVLGMQVPGNEVILKRMQLSGHEIGNHSWDHKDFTKLTPEQMRQQVDSTQAAIVAADVPAPTLFRPPYGSVNATVEQIVGMGVLLWNEDPHDWAAHTPEEVVAAVVGSAKPGAIIDLHDIYNLTANALPQIITDLRARGYKLVTVSELLDLRPESRGLYYGHP
jgi:peptidoglycan-N-acetylglucosamine deacetylase